jgi:nucleotide-binding universal stress UspA family protein
MYSRILIPTDGSEFSEKAIAHGLEIAKVLGSTVTVLRVVAPPSPIVMEGVVVTYPIEEARAQAMEAVGKQFKVLEERANASGVKMTCRMIEHDQPWRAICDAASEGNIDLIIMASHGRRGVSALVLGSETHKVLTHSTTPVLVYR